MTDKVFAALVIFALIAIVVLNLLLPQHDVVEYGLLVLAALAIAWFRMHWKRRRAGPKS